MYHVTYHVTLSSIYYQPHDYDVVCIVHCIYTL